MEGQRAGLVEQSTQAGSTDTAKGRDTGFPVGAGGAIMVEPHGCVGLIACRCHADYNMGVFRNGRLGAPMPAAGSTPVPGIADDNFMGSYELGSGSKSEDSFRKSENAVDEGSAAGLGPRGLPDLARFATACLLTGSARHAHDNAAVVRTFVDGQHIRGPDDITASAVEEHLAGLLAAGQSLKTIVNARSSISRWCKWLDKKLHLLTGNPALEVELATPEEVAPVVLDDPHRLAEIVRLASRQCGARGYGPVIADAIIVAVYAGLRLSELCRLEWADVDLGRRVLIVRKAKGKKFRVVSLARHARAALRRQRRRTEGLRWVFPARRTFHAGWRWVDRPASAKAFLDRLKPVQHAFAEFTRLAGKRIGRGWHLFRHTFATELCEADVSLKKTADWMGHVDIRMTARYIRRRREYDPDIERIMQAGNRQAPPTAGQERRSL